MVRIGVSGHMNITKAADRGPPFDNASRCCEHCANLTKVRKHLSG